MSASPITLGDALARAAAVAGPSHGLRFVDRAERARLTSWAELFAAARRVAGGLVAVGVAAGERVALVFPTGVEFFHAFFGAILAGAVPVPLYPPARLGRHGDYHSRTARMLEGAGARIVLADHRLLGLVAETVAQVRSPSTSFALGDLPSGSALTSSLPEVGAEDLALVQFSSGTTAEPRPVALTHRALLAQAQALNSQWPAEPGVEHSGVSWLPLYHDMGLIGCVMPALEGGATLTLLAPDLFVARPAIWLRTISRFRATVSPAPNFAYRLATAKVRDEELDGVDLSYWRVALNGAETVTAGVMRAFTERFARWGLRTEALTPVYGLSEAALAVTFSAIDRPFLSRRFDREALAIHGVAADSDAGTELVSVGRPLTGFAVRIVGPDGQELPAGRVGRVWVMGPSLMAAYLGQPAATAAAVIGGWLDTGDLGFQRDGELYLTGRAKDLIIQRGRNYSPETIEQAASALASVAPEGAAAVSWLPEEAAEERVLLFVEVRRGAPANEVAGLPVACREAVLVATGLAVAEVVVLPPGGLARTSSGKLRRREMLDRFLTRSISPWSQGIVTPDAVGSEVPGEIV